MLSGCNGSLGLKKIAVGAPLSIPDSSGASGRDFSQHDLFIWCYKQVLEPSHRDSQDLKTDINCR